MSQQQESLFKNGPYGLLDQWPITLLWTVEMLEYIAHDTQHNLQYFHEQLTWELHWALYLGLWWIFPDGAWKPWNHWGWELDNDMIIQRSFQSIKHAHWASNKNFRDKIDETLKSGREYFSDSEYEKLPAMFALLFVLNGTKYFSHAAMNILEERFLHEPNLQLNTPEWQPGRMWYIDDTQSYTQAEITEAMKGGESQSEKMKLIKKRQEIINIWWCPDCGCTTNSYRCGCNLPF